MRVVRLEASVSAVGLAVLLTLADSDASRLMSHPTPSNIDESSHVEVEAGAQCASRINLNEQAKPYAFFGAKANDAGQSLRQRLLVTNDYQGRQKQFTGQTDWHIEWRPCYQPVGAGCRIGGIDSTVNVTYTLPQWADRSAAPQRLRERWDNYIAGLTAHEKGHGEIAVRVALLIERELVGLADFHSCNVVGEASARIVEEVMQRGEALQRDYDRTTAHGSRQGAQFPF